MNKWHILSPIFVYASRHLNIEIVSFHFPIQRLKHIVPLSKKRAQNTFCVVIIERFERCFRLDGLQQR